MSERVMFQPEMILWHGEDKALVAEKAWAADNAEGRLERVKQDAKGKPQMVGDADPTAAALKAYNDAKREFDEAVEAVRHRATTVRVRALGRREWRDLLAEDDNKARPGNEQDAEEGWNVDTFPDAAVRAALVEPEFPSNSRRDQWLDNDVTPGEFDQIFELVKQATLGGSVDPKDLAYDPSSGSTGE